MRVAIAGLGGAARRGHLPALRAIGQGLTLAGAAEPDVRTREELAAVYGAVPTFSTAAEMLSAITCDMLVVATEPSSHAGLIALGMEHGLHVVCEKPVIVTRVEHTAVTGLARVDRIWRSSPSISTATRRSGPRWRAGPARPSTPGGRSP